MSDTDGEYSQEVCCNRKAETLHATPLSRLCLDRRLCEPWLPKECRSRRILIDRVSAPKEILHRNTGYPTSVPISRMNDTAENAHLGLAPLPQQRLHACSGRAVGGAATTLLRENLEAFRCAALVWRAGAAMFLGVLRISLLTHSLTRSGNHAVGNEIARHTQGQ